MPENPRHPGYLCLVLESTNQLGLSMGRAKSVWTQPVLDPPALVEEPETNCWKNQSSWFRVRVNVGRAGSVTRIKKASKSKIKIKNKKNKRHQNLEKLARIWKNSPETRKIRQNFVEIYIFR